jgi:hypothetical protein
MSLKPGKNLGLEKALAKAAEAKENNVESQNE